MMKDKKTCEALLDNAFELMDCTNWQFSRVETRIEFVKVMHHLWKEYKRAK